MSFADVEKAKKKIEEENLSFEELNKRVLAELKDRKVRMLGKKKNEQK